MTKLTKKISLIMPVYNGERFLDSTMQSVIDQTYANWELICVDDSSLDNSYNVLLKYAEKDKRIKVYRKQNERIASKGIIYALKLATGDYFMYSSQDDLFSVDLFEKNISKSIETNADFVLPEMKWYYGADDIRDGYKGVNGDDSIEITGRKAFVLSLNWQIPGCGLIKMDLVKSVGWYDYGYDSDDFTTRLLLLNSNKVVFSKGIFYYRQNNPNAITHKFSVIQFDSIKTCFKLEKVLIDQKFTTNDLQLMHQITYDRLKALTRQLICNKTDLAQAKNREIFGLLKRSYSNLNKRHVNKMLDLNMFSLFYLRIYLSVLKKNIFRS